MNNRILALDLSLSSTGWAVIAIDDRRPYLLDHGVIKTNAKETHGERLCAISDGLETAYLRYEPFIAIPKEKGFSRHASTTQALYKVHGVVEADFCHDNVVDIPPTTVKKLVTGSGKASKSEVETAVRQILGLRDSYEINTDDESDAMAVGLAYVIQNGLIEGGR